MEEFRIGDLVVKTPIVQGGMGVCVSLSGLASAVANEGGIGVISAVGIGMLEKDYVKNFRAANKRALKKEIEKAKSKTDGVLGVNIMYAISDFDDLLKVALDSNIDVVFIGAGMLLKKPENISLEYFKNTKTKFIPKVSSARATKIIFDTWDRKYQRTPDAIIIESPYSGGHQGIKMELIEKNEFDFEKVIQENRALLDSYEEKYGVYIPIIIGGGIYDGKDIYKMHSFGADAVKMGTRFVTTEECDVSEAFKMHYIQSKKEDSILINSPVGLPARVVRNKFVDKVLKGETKPFNCPWKCLKTCDYKKVPFCIAKALFNSAQGNIDEGIVFGGSNAYRAEKIQTVKETFTELINEYHYQEEMCLV